MKLTARLNSIRLIPESTISIGRKSLHILLVFVFGVSLGFLAKYVEGAPHIGAVGDLLNLIGDIGTDLGIWVFIATIIAVWSRSPKAGAVHVFCFFVGMLIAYYEYSSFLFGFFPKRYFLAWGTIALFSPIGGYMVWYGRGKGWISAFCASLPIGLLLSLGYSLYYTFINIGQDLNWTQGLDLIMAVILFISISKTWMQSMRILPFVIAVCCIIRQFHVLAYIFG
ncbi:hypothetical protein PMSD_27460 [Paenibacillus macquariensis subsp. defensor]|nr:hypothetical protein PMSD_27460 [Paenibacillus macquariensis subsp. defensor]